ncbi:MAG: hypothetical protein HOB72_25945, partial [Rhodospirillaceae bacterium]|nr:hypothetical protein [Rhodospirillaceae bacterium]
AAGGHPDDVAARLEATSRDLSTTATQLASMLGPQNVYTETKKSD